MEPKKKKQSKSKRKADEISVEGSYNSDEEPPAETAKDRLSWRLDPEESFSDWTIEIVSSNNNKTDTYHVHKCQLAVGPRRSEYFEKLFSEGGRFAETTAGKSRIEFDELAAKAFPTLLDYLYHHDSKPKLTTDNATALYVMAKYFGMRRLRWEAKQFWQKDIDRDDETCGVYYEDAHILQDDKVLRAATDACSDRIMSITPSSRLVHVTDAEFWLKILREDLGQKLSFICHVSTLLAAFFQNNQVDADVFKQLTSDNLLPHVAAEAALPLVDIERETVAPDTSKLSSLQQRCISGFIRDWNSVDLRLSATTELLKKQSPLVLSELLAETLSAASKDLKDRNEKIKTLTVSLEKANRKRYHRMHDSSSSSSSSSSD